MMKLLEKPIKFLRDVRVEMSKVTWPTGDELKASTQIVIIFSLLLAAFIFMVDQVLSKILDLLLKL